MISRDSHICVLGAGIIGLTTAKVLLDRKYSVVLASSRFSPDLTSDTAAAVWYPYAVSPKDAALNWSYTSYKKFRELAAELPELVSMVEFHELFRKPVGEPWWGPAVDTYRHLTMEEVPPGYVSGYSTLVPVVESSPYLKNLASDLIASGARIRQLEDQIEAFAELPERIVVNCTGMGAASLCKDVEMFPIRGQVLRVSNPGIALTYADDEIAQAPTYIVPRARDCILGGTATSHDSSLAIREEDTRSILDRCALIEPAVGNAEVLEVKVGLRPGRSTVRLETESVGDKVVIHNYGHGGAGFTLSWGCAEAAADEVAKSLR